MVPGAIFIKSMIVVSAISDLCAGVHVRHAEPVILRIKAVHDAVKVIEVAVLELRVVDEIPLAPRVVVAVIVTRTREVEPFRVSKFVSCSLLYNLYSAYSKLTPLGTKHTVKHDNEHIYMIYCYRQVNNHRCET